MAERRPWREGLVGWAAAHRGGLDVAMTLCGVATVAFAGLVIEDLVPVTGHEVVADGSRWGLAAVSGALLSGLVLLRSRVSTSYGTLYYVRCLFGWMSDTHLEDLRSEESAHLDVKVVSRWLTTRPRHGVLDFSDDVMALRASLETAANEDDVRTGFHVVPNLLWPAALALGYEFYAWPTATLREYDAQSFTWRLHPLPGNTSELAAPELRVEQPTRGGPVERVLVSVDLSPGAGTTNPGQVTRQAWYRVAVFDGPGVAAPSRSVLMSRPNGPDETTVHVDPWTAATTIVAALRRALHEHPEASVLFSCRIPKTVALAVGWWLKNSAVQRSDPGCGDQRCPNESCRYPWTRLVPLLFSEESNPPRFIPVRAHPGQPDVAEISSRLAQPDLP